MSDQFEETDVNEEQSTLSPVEQTFRTIAHQRKVVADALKNGTLSCLPGPDGLADTSPAFNVTEGRRYHGANMLFLKEFQKENGFPTAEFITTAQFDWAKRENPDFYIRQGQKGVSLHVSEKNEETGQWEDKHIRLFNIAQSNKPDKLREWAEQKKEERDLEYVDKMRLQFGNKWVPERKEKEAGIDIKCTSTDPEKYLGEYLAAVSMGSKFEASPEQAEEFKQKMLKEMYRPFIDKKGVTHFNKEGEIASDPNALEDISRKAGKHCREKIRDEKMKARNAEQPEQKIEQTQTNSRGGRSM